MVYGELNFYVYIKNIKYKKYKNATLIIFFFLIYHNKIISMKKKIENDHIQITKIIIHTNEKIIGI